jgi:hypothetical protein
VADCMEGVDMSIMVDFATAASQDRVCITQQMYHISRLLSYDKDIRNTTSNIFLLFSGLILIFLRRGKNLVSFKPVL